MPQVAQPGAAHQSAQLRCRPIEKSRFQRLVDAARIAAETPIPLGLTRPGEALNGRCAALDVAVQVQPLRGAPGMARDQLQRPQHQVLVQAGAGCAQDRFEQAGKRQHRGPGVHGLRL